MVTEGLGAVSGYPGLCFCPLGVTLQLVHELAGVAVARRRFFLARSRASSSKPSPFSSLRRSRFGCCTRTRSMPRRLADRASWASWRRRPGRRASRRGSCGALRPAFTEHQSAKLAVSCPRGWSRRMRQNERGGVRGSDQLFSRPAAAGPMGAPGGVRSGSCRAATQGPGGRAGVWAAPLRASRRRFSARNCGAARVPIDRLARTSRKVTSQPIGATMVRGCGPADVLCPRPSPHRIRRSQAGPSAVRAPASGETATPA